jgi:hypothetical protein
VIVEKVEHRAYEPPSVKDLGTLESITGDTGLGKKNEGASLKT